MTYPTYNFKKLILAGGTMFAMLAIPLAVNSVTSLDLGVISAAHAADDGGSSKKSGGHKGKAGSQKGAQGKGGASSNKIFRIPAAEEDSDRPVWAGVKGGKSGGGGKPAGAGSKKGDLYGDMVVLLRDANGAPILTSAGLVQVIAYVYDASGNLVPLKDASGNPVVIPYNADGDLVTEINGVPVYSAEVDLGRLSVGRAPSKVLDHSLTEALSKLTAGAVTLDSTGRLAVDGVTIDSPLENLALYDKYMTTGSLPGVTLPAGFNPASLLAAASDKYGSISVDTVVYMNSILGVNSTTYYNFSTTNYDRYTTWKNATAQILVLQPDGVTYKVETVNLYDAVFNDTNWVDPTPTGGADDFATAADDYRAVIEFVHDNAVR
ncbi:hypothetical protein [Thiobacillus sp.]|jgi:YD repeat-containing protein|uniref:hypothetical protein n=1 Tax=Thiobacillus sp. TaxID=924 RepID=UPI0025F26741|nr:hypothetical protein [Thiobacillus sp.]